MAPPPLLHHRHYPSAKVTEDTPPDQLEGSMDLHVEMPSGKSFLVNVHRSTPMMDLLVQVTALHRINPGGHVIQVLSDSKFLAYKPSTPIGTLDTNAIRIVAKNKLNEQANLRKAHLKQEAQDRNIRLKVNLPHNQLAVYRVPPKSIVSDLFTMICDDKNLDPDTHELRHPANIDERLRGSCSLADYQLQELCVVSSSDFRPPPLSVTDLITMSSMSHADDKKSRGLFGLFARKAKSSTGDSSVSSGSAGERSVSPAQSDESVDGRPNSQAEFRLGSSSAATLSSMNYSHAGDQSSFPSSTLHNSMLNIHSGPHSALSRPISMVSLNTKKKKAPPIPTLKNQQRSTHSEAINGKVESSSKAKKSLSRHSSDSSGYHETESKSPNISSSSSELSSLEAARNSNLPLSSNLTSVPSISLLSVSSKAKRRAPQPPTKSETSKSVIPESPEENISAASEFSPSQLPEVEIVDRSASPLPSHFSNEDVTTSKGSSDNQPEAITDENSQNQRQEVDKSIDKSTSSNNSISVTENSRISKLPCSNRKRSPSSLDLPPDPEPVVLSSSPNYQSDAENSVDVSPIDDACTNSKPDFSPAVVSEYPQENIKRDPLHQLYSGDQNEVQVQTVSLSSESSLNSLEMINMRDIQKPKRHLRKAIPKEFRMASSSTPSPEPKDSPPSFEGGKVCRKANDHFSGNKNKHNKNHSCERELVYETFNTDIKLPSGFAVNRISDSISNDVIFKTSEDSSDEMMHHSFRQVRESEREESLENLDNPSSIDSSAKASSDEFRSKRSSVTEFKDSVFGDSSTDEPRIVDMKLKNKSRSDHTSSSCINMDENSRARERVGRSLNNADKTDSQLTEPCDSSGGYFQSRKKYPIISSASPSAKDSPKVKERANSVDRDDFEITNPSLPGFSISTYQSRANKVSYGKKLARSESLSSVKDLMGQRGVTLKKHPSEECEYSNKISRSESTRRNEVLRINNMVRATSSTSISSPNPSSSSAVLSEGKELPDCHFPIRKSHSRGSILDNLSNSLGIKNDRIQFDISSAAEPLIFTRPIPKFGPAARIRKAKSTFDIRGISEQIIPENAPTTAPNPASSSEEGLSDEYKRLQDDFMKWQQQLMQNQELLHNRVVPIAANPPSINNGTTGRFGVGSGLKMGWKPPSFRTMVNAHGNQKPSASEQGRRPVEISIPIRFEDTGEVVGSDRNDQFDAPSPQQFHQPVRHIVVDQTQNDFSQSPFGFTSGFPTSNWEQTPHNSNTFHQGIIDTSNAFSPASGLERNSGFTPGLDSQSSAQFQSPNRQVNNVQQRPTNRFQNVTTTSDPGHPLTGTTTSPSYSKPHFLPDHPQSSLSSGSSQAPQQSRFQQTSTVVEPPPRTSVSSIQGPNKDLPSSHFSPAYSQSDPSSHFTPAPCEQNTRFAPSERISRFAPSQTSSHLPSAESSHFFAPAQNESNLHFAPCVNDFISKQKKDGSGAISLPNEEDNINARFSSVVTLGDHTDGERPGQKEKVRSVVQINNSDNSGIFPSDKSGSLVSAAPVSAKLVQQVNSDRSNEPEWRRSAKQPALNLKGNETFDPLASKIATSTDVQFRPETELRASPQRVRTPTSETFSSPSKEVFSPPPPPPPPSKPNPQALAPAPPPPPIPGEGRRTGSHSRPPPPGIVPGSVNDSELDAREELMMAIRQFGGANNLRRSPYPPCQ